jgi:hypothetical protein
MKRAPNRNRIDYIVNHNPKQVGRLLYEEGYEIPKSKAELCWATKLLVKKKGRDFIKKLLLLHPDRKAILQTQERSDKCGCMACGHKTLSEIKDKLEFEDQLNFMGTLDLERYYRNLDKQVKESPEDKNLEKEVDLVWNELRKRKKQNQVTEGEEKPRFKLATELLIAMGLTLLAGVLIGTSLQSKTHT